MLLLILFVVAKVTSATSVRCVVHQEVAVMEEGFVVVKTDAVLPVSNAVTMEVAVTQAPSAATMVAVSRINSTGNWSKQCGERVLVM